MPWSAALPYCSVYMVLLRCAELSCCSIFKFLRWIRFIIGLPQCTLACGKYQSEKVKLLCIDNTEYSTATCNLSRYPQHCVVFPHWQDALPSSSFLSFFFSLFSSFFLVACTRLYDPLCPSVGNTLLFSAFLGVFCITAPAFSCFVFWSFGLLVF